MEVEPKNKLMEEEVKTATSKVVIDLQLLYMMRLQKLQWATKRLKGCIVISFLFLSFYKDFGDKTQSTKGIMLKEQANYIFLDVKNIKDKA